MCVAGCVCAFACAIVYVRVMVSAIVSVCVRIPRALHAASLRLTRVKAERQILEERGQRVTEN